MIKLYEEKRKIYGVNTPQHISELLTKAKKIHYNDWLKNQLQAVTMNNLRERLRGKILRNLFYTLLKKKSKT